MNIQYPIVFVSDMEQATAFYRDVLELPLKFETPHWTEFATEGTILALHATDTPAAPEQAGLEPAGRVRIGFSLPDLDAFHQKMRGNDVPCIQEPCSSSGPR